MNIFKRISIGLLISFLLVVVSLLFNTHNTFLLVIFIFIWLIFNFIYIVILVNELKDAGQKRIIGTFSIFKTLVFILSIVIGWFISFFISDVLGNTEGAVLAISGSLPITIWQITAMIINVILTNLIVSLIIEKKCKVSNLFILLSYNQLLITYSIITFLLFLSYKGMMV